jgi:L-ornithine N5-monooxygenase
MRSNRSVDSICTGSENVLDCIGIGFGPANIALAIALEERGMLANTLFLEAQGEPDWQPGMLIEGSDIQHNPLRDLVTPRNPQSPYGFLSYLKAVGRLYDYLNLDAPFPPRTDYACYVRWVAEQFSAVTSFGCRVVRVEAISTQRNRPLVRVTTATGETFLSRTLSFATGRSPLIPGQFEPFLGSRLVHLNDYLPSVARWKNLAGPLTVGVIGGSQSAAEIILDLHAKLPEAKVVSICRRFGFKSKDLSPFTEQIYTPPFVDYFYASSELAQADMVQELWQSNYGAADHDVISALNFRLYEQKVLGSEKIRMMSNQTLESIRKRSDDGFEFALIDRNSGERNKVELDAVILATGFRNFGAGAEQEPIHPLLRGLAPALRFRQDGGVAVARDFRLMARESTAQIAGIYLNGLCESTHGFGDAGSFSLLSLRSDLIAQSIHAECYAAHALPAVNQLQELAA